MESLDIGWRSALMLALVLPVFVVAFVLFTRDFERAAQRFLGAFLAVIGVNLMPQIIGFAGFYEAFPWLTFAPFSNELWLGPLLLFHVLCLTKNAITKQHLLFFVPGMLQTSYYLIVFVSMPDYRDKWAFNNSFHEPFVYPIEMGLSIAVNLFCFVKAWRIIKAYQAQLLEQQSDIHTFKAQWLTRFFVLLLGHLSCWILFESYTTFIHPLSYIGQYPFHLLIAVIALWLGMQALANIREPFPTLLAVKSDLPEHLNESVFEQLFGKLMTQLELKQLYLTPKLSISAVASSIGTNETYLSRAINMKDMNFNQLINHARVEHAKGIISANKDLNMIDIALASGFSSKASFNRSFKEFVGKTPSQYLDTLA